MRSSTAPRRRAGLEHATCHELQHTFVSANQWTAKWTAITQWLAGTHGALRCTNRVGRRFGSERFRRPLTWVLVVREG